MHIQGFAWGPLYLNGNLREQHHSREKATCGRHVRQPCEGSMCGQEMPEVRWDGNIWAKLELFRSTAVKSFGLKITARAIFNH